MANRDYKSELLKVIEDANRWTHEHLDKKHPDVANRVFLHSTGLRMVVECGSQEEARAALHGADMMLAMLLEDAYKGQVGRHLFNPLPTVANAETINMALDHAYKDKPDENITGLRRIVRKSLEIGRSTLLEKTKYNPLKK
jgi:small nuclear ribonucleoprotein (snRNP)-like protein